jgi:hypothetical protein
MRALTALTLTGLIGSLGHFATRAGNGGRYSMVFNVETTKELNLLYLSPQPKTVRR